MAINDRPYFEFGRNLTPEQLAEMLALIPQGYAPGQADPNRMTLETDDSLSSQLPVARNWNLPGEFGPSIGWMPGLQQIGEGEQASQVPSVDGGQWNIGQARNRSTWGNSDTSGVWDKDGNWLGYATGATPLRGLANWGATSLAAYYGMQGMEGGGAGAGAAGSGGMTAADMAALDAAMIDMGAGAGGAMGGGAALAAPSTVAFDVGSMAPIEWGATELGTIPVSNAAAGTLGNTMLQEAGKTAASQAAQNGSKNSTGSGLNMGSLLGLAAGVADGQDRQQTSSRDPWAPAQPYLKGLLSDGAQLYDRYKQQPFSGAQQTAYGNQGGLLDAINANAGGLLQGFGANASGANNYDRANPRKQLTGGAAMDLSQWLPGLLGNYGTGGR